MLWDADVVGCPTPSVTTSHSEDKGLNFGRLNINNARKIFSGLYVIVIFNTVHVALSTPLRPLGKLEQTVIVTWLIVFICID